MQRSAGQERDPFTGFHQGMVDGYQGNEGKKEQLDNPADPNLAAKKAVFG
jgi:hypothetical protein